MQSIGGDEQILSAFSVRFDLAGKTSETSLAGVSNGSGNE
jgi:hypothetical protein